MRFRFFLAGLCLLLPVSAVSAFAVEDSGSDSSAVVEEDSSGGDFIVDIPEYKDGYVVETKKGDRFPTEIFLTLGFIPILAFLTLGLTFLFLLCFLGAGLFPELTAALARLPFISLPI